MKTIVHIYACEAREPQKMPSQVEVKYFLNNFPVGSVWIGDECYFAALANSQVGATNATFLAKFFQSNPHSTGIEQQTKTIPIGYFYSTKIKQETFHRN